ncbi:MAG: methyltransferase domain-containing protein, partial [Chloroflexi bacterium]|nr:methyltransferase domain-containing protein [Chloroflexota bacterium]
MLDVCTGSGGVAIELARRGQTVVGVDLSRGMLTSAGDALQRCSLKGAVHLVEGDAQRLPFPDGSFEAVIATRLVCRRTGWRIRLGTSWRLLRQIARESISYTLGMGLFALFPQFGIVALMMMEAGNETVAHYALAAQLIFTAAMPALVFSDALMPALRRLQRSGRGTEIGQLSKLFGLLLVGYTVVAVLTVAFGPWLVDLLFGQRYEATSRALVVMSWGLAPYSVMVITVKALYAVGAKARAMAVLTVANVAQAAVLVGLSRMGGVDGAVFAMLISSWLGCLLGVVLLRPQLPVSGTWWWAGPVAMTVVAAGIVGAGLIRGPWSALSLAASCLLVGYGLRFFTVSDIRGILSRLGIRAGDPTQGVFQEDIPSDRPHESAGRLRVCLLTSNLPRWPGDATTPFVLHLAQDLRHLGVDVEVLAPHAPGAKRVEILDGVPVSRFRYFWPAKGETLCYQGGALLNLRRSPSYWLKLPLFVLCDLGALRRLHHRRPFDVIHAHWILPQGFVAVLAGCLTR